ncbi:TPA: hypothetical protein ACH3KA_002695 [Legionella pneumophila]
MIRQHQEDISHLFEPSDLETLSCPIQTNHQAPLTINLATFFNMTKVPGSDHGERLLQHAIIHGKDQLVLTILEEPAVKVSFETS